MSKRFRHFFCILIFIFFLPYRYKIQTMLTIWIFSIYQISGQQYSRVLIGSRNSEYPWLFTVLRTDRKMARRFAKVSEEEIEEAFFYPSDLVNTKTTIPVRVGEERWIYTSTLRVSVYIYHYSPPLRGIVVYQFLKKLWSCVGGRDQNKNLVRAKL